MCDCARGGINLRFGKHLRALITKHGKTLTYFILDLLKPRDGPKITRHQLNALAHLEPHKIEMRKSGIFSSDNGV